MDEASKNEASPAAHAESGLNVIIRVPPLPLPDGLQCFPTLAPAINIMHGHERVWSHDISPIDGTKEFFVGSTDVFWDFYESLPYKRRCFYEIITENEPCFPYFDVDVATDINPETKKEEVVEALIQSVITLFNEHFGTLATLTRDRFLILDSSDSTKISYHVIVKPLTADGRLVAFQNIQAIRGFMALLRRSYLLDSCDPCLLCKRMRSNGAMLNDFAVDFAVYTVNRSFRLFLSTKKKPRAKRRYLVLSELDLFFKDQTPDERAIFIESLICRTPQDCILLAGPVVNPVGG